MRVWLDRPAHPNSGGMYRVFDGLYTYLPRIGIEITGDKDKADVVNPHIGLFSSFPPDIPMVISSHGMLWHEHNWGKIATKNNPEFLNAYRQADIVTAPSHFTARAITRYIGGNPIIVHHGINPDEWYPSENPDNYVIWNKARHDPANDPSEMNHLASLTPDVMYYSTYGQEDNNVYIFGHTSPEDMKDLVANAAVYLDTSKESGGPCFGILEAMACGVPVLSWNFGGTSEAITHLETGYLAEPYNYDDLVEGVFYCLNHRQRLGRNARQVVLDNYRWEQVIHEYAYAYQQAILFNNEEKVSVIVPCYNLGRFLPYCLDSILNQTYQNWEAVVVNDASSDQSWAIMQEYAARDSRIKVVNLPHNHHVSEARNQAVIHSSGKYILPLDADDRLTPNAVEDMVRKLQHDRSLSVVAGHLRIYSEKDLTGSSMESGWPNSADLGLQLSGYNRLPYSSMYRRKVWERVGGYRRRIRNGTEDADFWTRTLSYGYQAKILDTFTLNYTQRENSLGKQNDKGSDVWLSWFRWNERTAPANASEINNYDPPKVSIIIPVGPNHLPHLQACIDSLIAQTEDEWEAIVINDTGKPWFNEFDDPLNHYVLGMGLVRFIDGDTNEGVAVARNKGVAAAQSNKLIFLDVDDVAQPHMVEALLLAQDRVKGWVYGDWYINTGQGKLTYSEAEDWSISKIQQRMLGPITGLYQRDHILDVGGFDPSAPGWEDWDLQLKLLNKGICGTRLKTPLITYNMHLGKRREDNFENAKDLVQYIYEKHIKGKGIMACRSCGGGNTLAIKQSTPKANGSSVTMEDTVQLKYLGNERQRNRIKSKTHPGTSYTFSSSDPIFGIFKSDLAEFLNYRTPDNREKFQLLEQPKSEPALDVVEIPLSSEEVAEPEPVPVATPWINAMELDDRIIKLLNSNNYNTLDQLQAATDEDLLAIRGIGESRVQEIRKAVDVWVSQYLMS